MTPPRPSARPRPLRVLHCPDVVGGLAGTLAKAERALGAESWSVAFEPSPYGYPVDEVTAPPGTGRLTRLARRWGLLWRALTRFDVVHFNFGRTITPERAADRGGNPLKRFLRRAYNGLFELADVPLLKRFGKAVFVTFQGDDLRRGDFCATHFGPEFLNDLSPGYYTPEADARKRWRLSVFARHADRLYAVNPDLMHLLPEMARFLPYGHLDIRDWTTLPPPPESPDGPLVLHAPTDRGVKGTRHILAAVDRLRAEGVRLRFRLVEGLTRADARRLYEQADLLIDQLWLGWYGGLAVELMALGRPVVCHIRQDGLKYLPPGMAAELPLIEADPTSVSDVLREWLTTRRGELPTVGAASRRFVERWHDPLEVARGLLADYAAAVAVRRGFG